MPSRTGWIFQAKVVIGKGAAQRIADGINIIDFEFEEMEGATVAAGQNANAAGPGGSDKLKLTVDNYKLDNFDNPVWADGNVIQFQFGYPGNMSPQREAVITKVTGFAKLKIQAQGRTVQLNRIPKSRVFSNMKRSDVVKQIAGEYQLPTTYIDDTSETISQITQARMTDFQLLRDMAMREHFQVYLDQGGLHFHARKMGNKPIRTINYFTGGDGDTIGDPDLDSDITARPSVVVAKGRDPLKKADILATSGNAADGSRQGLAPQVQADLTVDTKTGEIKTNPDAPNVSGHVMATTETTQANAQKQATGAFQNAQSGAVKLKVTIVGDPAVTAKSVVEIKGIGKTLSGNYYVTKATHAGGANGYTTKLETRRDGRSQKYGATAASAAQVNSKSGPAAVTDELVERKIVDTVTGEVKTIYVDARGS